MTIDGLSDDIIRGILSPGRRIAMVGASNRPDRPSNGVLKFLIDQGFEVTPVNPGLAGQLIHGAKAVASLEQAPPLDMVDIFRASEKVEPVVTEAIRFGASTIWMQLGVVNEVAAAEARQAGLSVVMDRCPKIEFARLGLART